MLASMCRGSVILNQDCAQWSAGEVRAGLKQSVVSAYSNVPEAVRHALEEHGS
jgi:hypothetical protein